MHTSSFFVLEDKLSYLGTIQKKQWIALKILYCSTPHIFNIKSTVNPRQGRGGIEGVVQTPMSFSGMAAEPLGGLR